MKLSDLIEKDEFTVEVNCGESILEFRFATLSFNDRVDLSYTNEKLFLNICKKSLRGWDLEDDPTPENIEIMFKNSPLLAHALKNALQLVPMKEMELLGKRVSDLKKN